MQKEQMTQIRWHYTYERIFVCMCMHVYASYSISMCFYDFIITFIQFNPVFSGELRSGYLE